MDTNCLLAYVPIDIDYYMYRASWKDIDCIDFLLYMLLYRQFKFL